MGALSKGEEYSLTSQHLSMLEEVLEDRNPDAEFVIGAGHINLVKAINPVVVYEILNDDYIKFLCSIGWDTKRVRSISGDNSSCPQGTKGMPLDLNYPSMTALLQQKDKPFAINITRMVKNVGSANTIYKISVITSNSMASASLEWSDGTHTVRSPIVVHSL
ncbi:subtilisin-like protease SBT4.5 isoform X2 [Macadamia integrifolia]|uniref:subtilisin-like protease SBT4.5 isoform X2 n=1 Tax=Macadamia integrifolia TaxID=60698 RepID=UPI001C4F0BAF|nr:subtilisin-like protease SBT4.5 isoform X2 [Macadamia integrifolia]XP_042508544.1 subtilisin-like protease SBT4.5 isoform X2 [Macadamia integrifolia]